MPFAPEEDGFGDRAFPGSAKAERSAADVEAAIAAIRREGLTGRQLRMARRLAQKQGLTPSSDFDAVRLLREQGIDPFDRSHHLEVVHGGAAKQPVSDGTAPAAPSSDQGGARINLPQTVTPGAGVPGAPEDPDRALGIHEIERIQREIAARRRQKIYYLCARLAAFVLLPTLIAGYYFAFVATPSYATKSEFIVQQADAATMTGSSLFGGTAMATSQDSIMVQDFLLSREAVLKLDKDHDYREHFSDPSVDSLQRIEPDATNEDVYAHFKKNVKVGYDPTEGVLRMEVSALSPEMSQVFSEALIGYAEERVDAVTDRKRADQMRGARENFDEAETKMVSAQERVLALQEQLGILDPATESSAVMQRVTGFETELAEKQLQLQQLLDNEQPNQARVAGVKGDIARLEAMVERLRSELTEESAARGSLANVTAQLRMAEVDLETRTMMMQEALQNMEAARIEANRQVRFLSVGVAPVPPDEATYPKVFENTLIALLIFSGIYLLVSVTAQILREQLSH